MTRRLPTPQRTKTYDAPSENCIYRVLKAVPVLEFQQAVWAWQQARHGGQDGSVVVLDGKALRGSQVMPITPEQMGFPYVVQLARLDRIRELKSGRQEVETVWIITSLGSEKADAARLLELARQYWSIENRTHHRLDLSSGEDRCRVRHPVAASVLGILRRAVQGEYRAWARCQRKARDSTCPAFQERMGRRVGLALRHLLGEVSRL